MESLYLLMISALALLAIADLIIGVSNDAVNFLNSALGSKAVSFKTIMIVASIGVTVGAVFSSGLMEVARKGIFNPDLFVFSEIMIVFMAVMITDILLLDFFNTIGLPTSTTVSIVFELLGAAVAISLVKIYKNTGEIFNLQELANYINTSKATEIIIGILLSVVIAFSIGAFVQWVSRLLLSYNFENKAKWVGALFGGIALSAITYFIFIKGIKGTPYANESFAVIGNVTIKQFLEYNIGLIISVSLIIWFLFSYLFVTVIKKNIYVLIIIVGTFALALAFAGNDLVNFIGVPMAALDAFNKWSASGIDPTQFNMSALSGEVKTPTGLLVLAGVIMVVTLWFSSKAKNVVKTSIDLSSQSDTKERFKPNFLSRFFVRITIYLSRLVNYLIPKSFKIIIDKQFEVSTQSPKSASIKTDAPAFDLVRASVNLMVASVLISVATSMKLPLSTTYVTFMVAMGTSLADRAWGAESAVYRVAGVLNVIGGWFFTAFSAFLVAGIIALLLNTNVQVMFPILFALAVFLLARSYYIYSKASKESREEDELVKAESSSTQGVIHESATTIASVSKRTNKIYTNAIKGLAKQDLAMLKANKKQMLKLSDEIDNLKDNLFYFIKNLDESSVNASSFYINILGHLQDMGQSLEYIVRISHKHINNNHKKLKFSQIKELKQVDDVMETLFSDTTKAFKSQSFEEIGGVLSKKEAILSMISDKIKVQIERTRKDESSPKNTTLYFNMLTETKDLLTVTMDLLEEYYTAHDSSVKPAKIAENDE